MEERKKVLLQKLSGGPSLREPIHQLGGSATAKWTLIALIVFGLLGATFFLKSQSAVKGKPTVTDSRSAQSANTPSGSPSADGLPTGLKNYALNASGYVIARRMATVSSESTGKVLNILVEEGQHVSKGEILATLDSREASANFQLQSGLLNSILADILGIESKVNIAKKNVSRSESLFKKNLVSVAAYDNDLAKLEQLNYELESKKASLDQARGALALAKKRLDDTSIRAPFDGVITMRNAQPGEIVSPVSTGGGFTRTGICTLVDMGSLETEVDVNENYISKVFVNQPADVVLNAFPDKKYSGKVVAIIPQANRQSSTIKVRVKFQELDLKIFPDMGVAVSFHEK